MKRILTALAAALLVGFILSCSAHAQEHHAVDCGYHDAAFVKTDWDMWQCDLPPQSEDLYDGLVDRELEDNLFPQVYTL